MINWAEIARRAFDANAEERERLKKLQKLTIEANSELERMIKKASPFNARTLDYFDPMFGSKAYEVRVRFDPRTVVHFAGGDMTLVEHYCDMVRAEVMHSIMREIHRDPRP